MGHVIPHVKKNPGGEDPPGHRFGHRLYVKSLILLGLVGHFAPQQKVR